MKRVIYGYIEGKDVGSNLEIKDVYTNVNGILVLLLWHYRFEDTWPKRAVPDPNDIGTEDEKRIV